METSTNETTESEAVEADSDKAVRAYLNYLQDPKSIVDLDEIAKLTQELDNETDLLQQLRLASAIASLRSADGTEVQAGFVRHAKSWAEDNLTIDFIGAFKSLNVPTGVLREAGFPLRGGGKRTGVRVGTEAVRNAIGADPFTIQGVVTVSGASPATVRNVVLQMVKNGDVAELGPDPDHAGRGRRGTQYQRS